MARGYHVRNVLPGNRRALPPVINMHSVKNRFLMRIKNMTPDLYRRNWFPSPRGTWWCWEPAWCANTPRSRLSGYLVAQLEARLGKRQEIMRRRRAKDDYIASWFSYQPVSRPAPRAHSANARQDPRRARLARLRIHASVRFAIVGTRGIPARYGGFETFAEELSTRLAARGHTVTVYCRERHTEPALSRRASSVPAHHPPQIPRHDRPHVPFDACI